jgi:hypothetical protein
MICSLSFCLSVFISGSDLPFSLRFLISSVFQDFCFFFFQIRVYPRRSAVKKIWLVANCYLADAVFTSRHALT